MSSRNKFPLLQPRNVIGLISEAYITEGIKRRPKVKIEQIH
jgi:hypothetical protein